MGFLLRVSWFHARPSSENESEGHQQKKEKRGSSCKKLGRFFLQSLSWFMPSRRRLLFGDRPNNLPTSLAPSPPVKLPCGLYGRANCPIITSIINDHHQFPSHVHALQRTIRKKKEELRTLAALNGKGGWTVRVRGGAQPLRIPPPPSQLPASPHFFSSFPRPLLHALNMQVGGKWSLADLDCGRLPTTNLPANVFTLGGSLP
jgi:hypothetical protein